ncbi:MAG TPA: hypothetical protein VF331_17665 [Polyangiales bacterium]
MGKSDEQLQALADRLERAGDDPARVDIVRRAQRFKRSWIELAEGLLKLRKSRAYERWGYADLHEYCNKELHIKQATVDKLMLSYSTLQTHAPEVLKRDGVSREIPTIEAVDYFTRAFGANDEQAPAHRRLDAPKGVLAELRSAVFDEGQSASELRKRFDPILRPKDESDENTEALRKAKALAERLGQVVQGIDGLAESRVGRVLAVVEALVRDLDGLIEKAPKPRASKGKHAA